MGFLAEGFLSLLKGRLVPLASLPLVAESFISCLITHHADYWKPHFPESGALAAVFGFFLPCTPWSIHLRTLITGSAFATARRACTRLQPQKGSRCGSALGVLGVPTHPVGRSSGILRGLVCRFPDEVLKRSAGTVFPECTLMLLSASFPFLFLPSNAVRPQ